MPVYTLNPSHRRATKRKASSTASLRERVSARRNPGAHDLAAIEARLKFLRDEIHMDSEEADREFSRLLAKYKAAGGAVKRVGGPYPGTSVVLVGSEVAKWQAAGKRRNPLSEDGAVVSNPRAAKGGRWVNVTLSTAKGQTIGEERYEHPWFGTYTFDEMALDMASRAPIGSIVTIRDGTLEDRYKVVNVPHLGGRGRGIQKMRRRNPLSEDGAVVSNPRPKAKAKRGSKRSGGRTAAQSNAARAMKLFHSGQASSLGEAWEMIRGGR